MKFSWAINYVNGGGLQRFNHEGLMMEAKTASKINTNSVLEQVIA
jgi:hypothetical protein